MSFKLIVGLNNPGAEYEKTRHNAGAWFVQALASSYSLEFKSETKFKGQVARIQVPGVNCWLLLPSTFMNLSGQSIQALAHFYKIEPDEILVVHDDLDHAVGQVRLKLGGGAAGNNGISDTISKLGKNFWRLRIGIDRPQHSGQVTSYVLKAPSKDDRAKIDDAIDLALREFDLLLRDGGTAQFMNRVHRKED